MGRIVDDNFEATEYDMSVIKQSVFDIEHIALADYYNQENLKNGLFKLDRNVDEYGVQKNIHSAYAEATYQLSSHFIANVGLKYDDVHINVDYNVNREEQKEKMKLTNLISYPASICATISMTNMRSVWQPARLTLSHKLRKYLRSATLM